MRFLLNRFNEGLFANVSTTRLSVPKVFMSYEEQCRAIREGDDNKLYHFRGHLIQVCCFTVLQIKKDLCNELYLNYPKKTCHLKTLNQSYSINK